MNVKLRNLEIGKGWTDSWITSLNKFNSVMVLHGVSTKAIITKKHKEYVGFTESSTWFR